MSLILTFISLASASILAVVWAAELGGLAPCPLCLQQRYAYYIAFVLSAYGVFCARHFPQSIKGLLIVIGILFAGNSLFGFYHAGIEYGWWAGPSGCAGGAGNIGDDITSTKDLLLALQNETIISCSTPAFRFLSLSLAGYNALASLGLSALAFYGARK